MNSDPHNVLTLKEQLIDKEKLIERQKRLTEQRDFLKDKFKSVGERKTTASRNIHRRVGAWHKNDDSIDEESFSTAVNRKKPFKSVPLSSDESCAVSFSNSSTLASVIKNQQKPQSVDSTTSTSTLRQHNMKTFLQSVDESVIPLKSKYCDIGMYTQQDNPKSQMSHAPTPPNSPTKYKKVSRNTGTSKRTKFESKQGKYNGGKKVSRNKSKPKEDKFFSAPIVDKYLKNARNDSFELPNDEYRDLMRMKSSVENSQLRINKLLHDDLPKRKKCFYHVTPLLETREDDGPITDCHVDKKHLILVQRDAINVYYKKEKNAKEWIFKDSMRRLRFKDVLKEMIMSCNIKKKETVVLCQIHVSSDEFNKQSYIKMAQYRFLDEKGKIMKEYNLGSYDCALEDLRCCHITKKQCCVAITGWNIARSRTVGWVFTYSDVNDTMKCGAMIPLKHKVESLHDISLSPYRNVLLAFGGTVFTIWNAKTGERLSCCSLETISPKHITCHFGCFATIQKGFLFILANTEDKLHMIATNLDTEVSKSLRKFRIPRGNKCVAIGVKDDKLVGLMDKSIVCWSLKNTLRIQQIRLEDGETPFLNRGKILIATNNKIKRILTIKSDSDYRDDMANKMRELMASETADNEPIPMGATAEDIQN